MTEPDSVEIVEVALRDGLQNESTLLSTADKIEVAARLAAAGARRIEAVSFVHPKWVPAMADAEAVMAGIDRVDGVSYSGLILNQRGLDRAQAAGMDEVNVIVCASDTFSRRNQNVGRDEAIAIAVDLLGQARAAGIFTTLTVATAFGCPFEGEVAPGAVLSVIEAGLAAGAEEYCLADTIGVAGPAQVRALADGSRLLIGPAGRLRFHFHNTRNTGFANAWQAILSGARALDASVGGIGGCPFAPQATGNIATDDLGYLLERSGVHTGLDLDQLIGLAGHMSALLGKPLPSLLPRAGNFPSS